MPTIFQLLLACCSDLIIGQTQTKFSTNSSWSTLQQFNRNNRPRHSLNFGYIFIAPVKDRNLAWCFRIQFFYKKLSSYKTILLQFEITMNQNIKTFLRSSPYLHLLSLLRLCLGGAGAVGHTHNLSSSPQPIIFLVGLLLLN